MNYTIITDEKIKEKLEKVFKLHNERVTILQQKSKTNRGLYALLLEEGTKITYSPEKFTQESLNEFLKEIPFSKQTYGIDPCIIDYITLIKKKTKKGGL